MRHLCYKTPQKNSESFFSTFLVLLIVRHFFCCDQAFWVKRKENKYRVRWQSVYLVICWALMLIKHKRKKQTHNKKTLWRDPINFLSLFAEERIDVSHWFYYARSLNNPWRIFEVYFNLFLRQKKYLGQFFVLGRSDKLEKV